MGIMHDLIYNKTSLNSLGFAIKTKPFYKIAERDFELVSVLGHSGDIIVDNGVYKNVPLSYSVNSIPHRAYAQDSQQLAYQFIDWLSCFDGDYKILRDTYNKGYFCKAICQNVDEISNNLLKYLDTTINFSRQPYWYSDLGQTQINSSSKELIINNPEKYSSEPYIKIKGSGCFDVSVNNTIIRIKEDMTDYIEIDTELQSAFKGSVSCNDIVNCDYMPVFTEGQNIIKITPVATGTINPKYNGIEIIPRWRRL